MEKIDWSKAPRDAHGYMPQTSTWIEGWWKRDTNCYFWSLAEGSEGGWRKTFASPFDSRHFVPRPSPAWSGEGLPPVGTVCEYIGGKHGMPDPWPAEVIHHYHGGACMVAAFLYTRDGQTRVAGAIDSCFRPIRTSEQIAADEREAAIKEMLEDAGRPDTAKTRDQAQLLYDAGWRKVERAQ